jgi:HPt (histidine-containing phosphotransfer) domain-containing protein
VNHHGTSSSLSSLAGNPENVNNASLSHTLDITDGDIAFLKELIALFTAEYPERLARIAEAITKKDYTTIYQTAHSLKGSSANLGLLQAHHLASEIEASAKQENLQKIRTLHRKLEKELHTFTAFVSRNGWERE